jgi:hypothetical protein
MTRRNPKHPWEWVYVWIGIAFAVGVMLYLILHAAGTS